MYQVYLLMIFVIFIMNTIVSRNERRVLEWKGESNKSMYERSGMDVTPKVLNCTVDQLYYKKRGD